MIKYEEQVT